MNTDFDRIISLAQKTGSRLVVYDREGGKHMVVLGVDDFEQLVAGEAKPTTVAPQISPRHIEPEPVPEIDRDLAEDEALLQILNQRIADWRRAETEKMAPVVAEELVAEETVAPEKPTFESKNDSELELPPMPVQKVEASTSGGWHKLGEVMAGSFSKVRYEPLGESAIQIPVATSAPEYAEAEPLNDDPVFLEEPLN